MKMMRFLLLALCTVMFAGCTNFYEKFYKSTVPDEAFGPSGNLVPHKGKVTIRPSSNLAADHRRMLEKGYWMVGQAGFGTVAIGHDGAIEVAKKRKAAGRRKKTR